MREILFRGFHKDKNGKETIYLNGKEIKGEWIEGYLVCSEDYIFDYSERIDIPYIIPINNFNLEDYRQYEVIPETVGQYTGLKDKIGQKIFEGDVIKCHYKNAVKDTHVEEVVFYRGKFMAYTKKGTAEFWSPLYDGNSRLSIDEGSYMDEMEIIGTIFDKEVK